MGNHFVANILTHSSSRPAHLNPAVACPFNCIFGRIEDPRFAVAWPLSILNTAGCWALLRESARRRRDTLNLGAMLYSKRQGEKKDNFSSSSWLLNTTIDQSYLNSRDYMH